MPSLPEHMMAARKTPTKLTQREVQEAIIALLRIATVWARRSFEEDEPVDRPEDEKVLRKVVDALAGHGEVPLARSTGSTKFTVRERDLQELKLFRLVLAVIRGYREKPSARRGALSRWLKDAFRRAGVPLTPEVRAFADKLGLGAPPVELAGLILSKAGFKSYRSIAEIKRSALRARAIRRRRSVTRLELVQYLLACLQVPEEDLHGIAAAIEAVMPGGTLTATPTPWHRRSRFGGPGVPPWKRPYYERYAQANIFDSTRAELGGVDLTDFGGEEEEVD